MGEVSKQLVPKQLVPKQLASKQLVPKQLVLDLPLRPALGRDDFFVSSANEQAVAVIDKWPDWPNPVQVLTGAQGSGKSHLAEVWRQASGAQKITAKQLDIEQLPFYLSNGALLVEDLPGEVGPGEAVPGEAVPGKPVPGGALNETALFHLINLTREQGAFLLLTALKPPAQWNIQLADLASRLAAAGSVGLAEPDDVLLRAILIKQFSDRQITVDEAIISFMLARMERSAGAARDLVTKIDNEALRQKANVTRPFVSAIMSSQSTALNPDSSEV